MIEDAQAQMYANEYGHDSSYNKYYPEPKSSHTDIQKIKCINSNINVNGIDITQIPQDGTGVAAANEEGAEAANAQNGNNGIANRINFERNLVNICINYNQNDQLRISEEPEPLTCEECFTKNLDQEEVSDVVTEIREISRGQITTLEELCERLSEIVASGNQGVLQNASNELAEAFQNAGLSEDQFNTVLDCLNDIFNNAIPPPQLS
jgi:hypothetical protein